MVDEPEKNLESVFIEQKDGKFIVGIRLFTKVLTSEPLTLDEALNLRDKLKGENKWSTPNIPLVPQFPTYPTQPFPTWPNDNPWPYDPGTLFYFTLTDSGTANDKKKGPFK